MTVFIYDQFAKLFFQQLLALLGVVFVERPVVSEVRKIDIVFIPKKPNPETIAALGLLGQLVTTVALFEPFRNPVTANDIRSCMAKLYDLQAEFDRDQDIDTLAGAKPTQIQEDQLAQLWIITPTASERILEKFGAKLDEAKWGRGIYSLSPGLKTHIIVVHQLPSIPETLWLRMLGRGTVQKKAIEELKALPEDHPFRVEVLKLWYDAVAILEAREDLKNDDREVIMELAGAFERRLQRATQEGIEQGIQLGIQQGQQAIRQSDRLVLETMLSLKYGAIDAQLESLIEPLLELSVRERIALVMQLDREQLIARMQQK